MPRLIRVITGRHVILLVLSCGDLGRVQMWARLHYSVWSHLPLHAKQTIFNFAQVGACVIFINLRINRIGIKYLTGGKLGHIAPFTLELRHLFWSYMPLFAGTLDHRWAIVAHWSTCYVRNSQDTSDFFLHGHILVNEPGHEKMCLMPYANNKGADQPAHPRSLISALLFAARTEWYL